MTSSLTGICAADKENPSLEKVPELFTARKYQQAKAKCDAYIKKTPKDYLGYYWRGKLHYQLMQYPAALSNANKAIELETKKPEPFELRADVYIFLGQFDRALRDLSAALKNDSSNRYDIFMKKAKCYSLLAVDKEVIANLTEALTLKQDATTYRQRADAYYKLRKYKEAIEDYSKALVDDPDSFEMRTRRAYSYQQTKNGIEAVKDYSYLLEANPIDWRTLERRANVYFDYGENEKALKDITDGIREFRGYKIDSLYKLRAKIYSKLGQNDKALKDLSKIRSVKKKGK